MNPIMERLWANMYIPGALGLQAQQAADRVLEELVTEGNRLPHHEVPQEEHPVHPQDQPVPVPQYLLVPPPPPPRPEDIKGKGKGIGKGKGKGKGKDLGDLTTLGLLMESNQASGFSAVNLEQWYLRFIHKCLTVDWASLQSGSDQQTLDKVIMIFRVLELDRKACMDWFLLAHSGLVGRTEASYVLWTVLELALKKPYRNLSNKVTSLVGASRRSFDRPPKNHQDRRVWAWHLYEEPRYWDFSPSVALMYVDQQFIQTHNGVPLRPPFLWTGTDF